MSTVVPESSQIGVADERARTLGDALDGLLEFTGAMAGWIGLRETSGRLAFPVRRGAFPDTWLTLQQAQGTVWGFEVREGPTLLNDIHPLLAMGEPPLANLLSCPLGAGSVRGHVVLANKPHGFTSHDSAVLQAVAHLMQKWLGHLPTVAPGPVEQPAPLWQRVLDRASEGIVVLDANSTLVYANATWMAWTGFSTEEIFGRPAPFPFWVSHRELATIGGLSSVMPTGALPFRRKNQSLFWCRVETVVEQHEGHRLTIASLYPVPPRPGATAEREVRPTALPLLLEELPFGVALTDREGQVVWGNPALDRLAPGPAGPLRARFAAPSAAALERLVRDPGRAVPGQAGSLILQRDGGSLTAAWLAIGLPGGPGFLFALTDDPEGFALTQGTGEGQLGLALPRADWLALLLRPAGEIGLWGERWEKLTGLSGQDLHGVRGEVVLDWLFPRQRDRDLVADWLHQASRQGNQAVLDVVTRTGSRPMLCTLLPAPEAWLLLVGEPELFGETGSPSLNFVRQFARGLGVLLNHYFTVPIGLAEIALDRPDLPAEVAAWFQQILDSSQQANQLLASLEDLTAVSTGETQRVPLAALVREFLDGQPPPAERNYELVVDLRDADAPVMVNRRMIHVVLRHLFRNAIDALVGSDRRRVEVRVAATDETVRCEIHDTGEGLGSEDWGRSLVPFFSTKGPFAKDPAHAAQPATGLGLTVCQHLLALHDGRLELRSPPGEGTTAVIILPRAEETPASATPETVRADTTAEVRGPHPRIAAPKAESS
jgi:signal transduction histidine kinase